MSLTKEVLTANESLQGLEESQVNAIIELSVNDENTVIGVKTGEIYGGIDKDVTEVLGIEKPEKKKTYDWLKEDVLPLVKKSKEFETELTTIKTEKQNLEEKIAKGDGLDENLKNQVEEKTNEIERINKQFQTDKKLLDDKIDNMAKENFNMRIDFVGSEAEKELKFKDTVTDSIKSILIKSVKSDILNEFSPDFVDNGNSGKTLVFKKDGIIQNNPDNKLNPYTLGELYKSRLKENLKSGNPNTTGTGSINNKGDGKTFELDLSGAKTQIDADVTIKEYLMAKGIARGTTEFTAEHKKLRAENKINELKLR